MPQIDIFKLRVSAKQAADELAEIELKLKDLRNELKSAEKEGRTDLYADLRTEQIALQQQSVQLRKEIRKQTKEFQNQELPEDSLIRMRQRLGELKEEYIKLSRTDPGFDALQKDIKQLNDEISEAEQATGDFRRNVGNYEESVTNALGNVTDAIGGNFSSLAAGLGAGGAIGAAISFGVEAFNAVNQLSIEYIETQRQVALINRVSGAELINLTNNVIALGNAFELENEEIARAAGQIQDNLNVTSEEAARLLGLSLAGSANAGETLSRVNDELKQLSDLDLPADSVLAIITDAANRGVNIDVLAEPIIRLREATPATVEALESAFGKDGAGKLFKEFETAPLSALKKISDRLGELPPRSKEAGLILADVFAGAGEDAVAAARNIGDIETSLDSLIEKQGEYGQRQLDLIAANEELAAAQGFLSQQIAGSDKQFGILTTNLKTTLIGALGGVIARFRALSATLKNFFSGNFEVVTIYDIIAEDAADAIKNAEELEETEKAAAAQRNANADELRKRFSASQKVADGLAKTSVAFLNKEVARLNDELSKAPDETTFSKINDQLEETKLKLDQTQARYQRFVDAQRGITDAGEAFFFITPTEELGEVTSIDGDQSEILQAQQTEEAILSIKKTNLEAATKLHKDNAEQQAQIEKDRKDKLIEITTELGDQSGEIIGQFLTNTEISFEEFSKTLLLIALNAAEKTILIATGEILAKQIAKGGFAGIASAALLNGLVRGVFAGIKSQIQSFAYGGVVESQPGIITARPNVAANRHGDNVAILAKPGEMILNKKQQYAAESMFGSSVWSAIGVPGFPKLDVAPQLIPTAAGSGKFSGFIDSGSMNTQAATIAAAINETVGPILAEQLIDGLERMERRRAVHKKY